VIFCQEFYLLEAAAAAALPPEAAAAAALPPEAAAAAAAEPPFFFFFPANASCGSATVAAVTKRTAIVAIATNPRVWYLVLFIGRIIFFFRL
jgi:hypothetical protein